MFLIVNYKQIILSIKFVTNIINGLKELKELKEYFDKVQHDIYEQ